MPRGFERNIQWDSDPEKQPRYAPELAHELRKAAMLAQAWRQENQAITFQDCYDLGFLASCGIRP